MTKRDIFSELTEGFEDLAAERVGKLTLNESSGVTPSTWVDPDDAPDMSEANLEHAVWRIGERVVTREEGAAALRAAVTRGRPVGTTKPSAKQAVTVRDSPEVLAAFKATGGGWQAHMNGALRDWLRTHKPV